MLLCAAEPKRSSRSAEPKRSAEDRVLPGHDAIEVRRSKGIVHRTAPVDSLVTVLYSRYGIPHPGRGMRPHV
jgi:hypothetical protein